MENERNILESNKEVVVSPNRLYYELEKYKNKDFLLFLFNEHKKQFNISEKEETVCIDKTFNRETYKITFELEDIEQKKKIILEGASNNYGNDGGMPHDFKVLHDDFTSEELDNMLLKFEETWHEWNKRQN